MVSSKKMSGKGELPTSQECLFWKWRSVELKILNELSPALTLPPGACFQAVMALLQLVVRALSLLPSPRI